MKYKKTTKKYRNLFKKLFGSGLKEDEAIKLFDLADNYTEEQLKSSYRKLAKKYHPDMPDGDENRFIEVQASYELLTDYLKERNKPVELPIVKRDVDLPIVKKDEFLGKRKVDEEYEKLKNEYNGMINELQQLREKEKNMPLTKYEDKLKPELIKLMLATKQREEADNDNINRANTNNSGFQKKILEHYDRILAEEFMFNQPPSAFTGHGLRKVKAGCYDGGKIKKKSCDNPWMAFLSAFREQHKGEYTVPEMTQEASKEYKRLYRKIIK